MTGMSRGEIQAAADRAEARSHGQTAEEFVKTTFTEAELAVEIKKLATTSVRQLEFGMRSMGNYYSEWADARGYTRRTLLATFVACAVGATRKCGSYFLPRKLFYNTIRRTADFTESDSAERRCS